MNIFKFFKKKLKLTHVCEYKHTHDSPHFWKYVNGKAVGMCSPIDELLKSDWINDRPQDFINLNKWKSEGYNSVHTSWREYKCVCGKRFWQEFYCEPAYLTKSDFVSNAVMNEVVKMAS